MLELNLPKYLIKIYKDKSDNLKVFDPLRKKYVALTPEEYVRQHFINYIVNHLHYPIGLTSNEVTINLNNTTKRCDTVVFKKDGTPLMIIEYKAPNIEIDQNVFDQIVRYNMVLHADYLVVSNGIQHYCCKINYNKNSFQFIPQIPTYEELLLESSQN